MVYSSSTRREALVSPLRQLTFFTPTTQTHSIGVLLPVIDEKALVRAMKTGKVSRVGLDVFEREPEIEPYLLETERATLLPHWATHTTRTQRETEREMVANFFKWVHTGRPNTPINEPSNPQPLSFLGHW